MLNNTKPAAEIVKLARAAFPEYKGRTIRATTSATYTMSDYWDGGSRSYVKAVELATGRMVDPSSLAQNPMNGAAHATVRIPAGVALIDHSFFCGRDCGLRVITAPIAAIEDDEPTRSIPAQTMSQLVHGGVA